MNVEYQPPRPLDEDKQCFECKHCYYDGELNMSHCEEGNGAGSWSVVDSQGTCEGWISRG